MSSNKIASTPLAVFVKPHQTSFLFIGESAHTAEKLKLIAESSDAASITIFSEQISSETKELSKIYTSLKILERQPEESEIKKASFIFAATENEQDAIHLKNLASKHSVLICFENFLHLSDFELGASVNKGQLHVAVAVDHVSKGVTGKIKQSIHELIPDELEDLLGNLSEVENKSVKSFREKVSAINRFTKEINRKDEYVNPYAELENTSKIVKTAQLKANLYLGVIGVMLVFGLFFLTIYEFNLFPDVKAFLNQDNKIFYWMLLVGFLAEIVAGSMGMGYGVICTTVLLLLNVPPPVVSASIHSAESFTTAAGSISHYKLKNVNMKLVKSLAPYAVVGAIAGAVLLTWLGEHYATIVKPLIALYTLILGARILKKSLEKSHQYKVDRKKSNLKVLGVAGGFIDSFAGGGWGPLVTGSLIKDGRTPRYVVGSSTVAKFILTVTSAVTFIFTIGIQHWNIVLGLLLGGIVTAPFSAMLTSRLPVKKMTVAISLLVIIMSMITIVKSFIK